MDEEKNRRNRKMKAYISLQQNLATKKALKSITFSFEQRLTAKID